MTKNFGGIELGGTFGGYEILNIPANKLPQDVASAMSAVNSNPLLGATYNPIWYVGKQLVNGTNYFFIAEDIRSTKNKDKSIVGLIINVPPGEHAVQGAGAKIDRIIESEKLAPEIQNAFTTVEKGLTGVSFKPVVYIGKQVVKGENHFIVCEAKTLDTDAQPHAVIFIFNVFEGKPSVVGILPIGSSAKDEQTLFGYAFNW